MNQNKWIEIKSEEDMKNFMELYGYFRDGCIKEIRYNSGMYVAETLSMNPINNKRDLFVLFQRQWKNPTTIEMMFEKIDCLYLRPLNEDYDGIIFGAYMCFEDNKIVWFDSADFDEDDYKQMYNKSYITWVRASSVKYRIVESYLGEEVVYVNRDIK